MEFVKNSFAKIWEGFLGHIGVYVTAFVFYGGYFVAINKLKEFQSMVRSIPSDYFLTPLVLLLVLLVVMAKINRTQQKQLFKLEQEPEKDEKDAQFVTHAGVWWKIYSQSEYIEDFPYCACCNPRLKLVQTDWQPEEVFKCPKTDTKYQLIDKVPLGKDIVLTGLYENYFHRFPNRYVRAYLSELRIIKELHPDMPDSEITKKLFGMTPFSSLPDEVQQEIIDKHPNPEAALGFLEFHYDSYKKYFKKKLGH